MKTGIKRLTTTTGEVSGRAEIRAFLRVARRKFSNVEIVAPQDPVKDFLQYTLLTDNKIRVYYKD